MKSLVITVSHVRPHQNHSRSCVFTPPQNKCYSTSAGQLHNFLGFRGAGSSSMRRRWTWRLAGGWWLNRTLELPSCASQRPPLMRMQSLLDCMLGMWIKKWSRIRGIVRHKVSMVLPISLLFEQNLPVPIAEWTVRWTSRVLWMAVVSQSSENSSRQE